MRCYSTKCKDECNDFKAMYCIRKVTEQQYKLIRELKGTNFCSVCGRETIAAKHIIRKNNYRNITLCTYCKEIRKTS